MLFITIIYSNIRLYNYLDSIHFQRYILGCISSCVTRNRLLYWKAIYDVCENYWNNSVRNLVWYEEYLGWWLNSMGELFNWRKVGCLDTSIDISRHLLFNVLIGRWVFLPVLSSVLLKLNASTSGYRISTHWCYKNCRASDLALESSMLHRHSSPPSSTSERQRKTSGSALRLR